MINNFEGYFGWLLLVLYFVIYIVEIISYKSGVDNIYFYLTTYFLNNLIRIVWPFSGYLLFTYLNEKLMNDAISKGTRELGFLGGLANSFFTGLFSYLFAIIFTVALTITVIVILSFFNTFSKKRLDNIYKKNKEKGKDTKLYNIVKYISYINYIYLLLILFLIIYSMFFSDDTSIAEDTSSSVESRVSSSTMND